MSLILPALFEALTNMSEAGFSENMFAFSCVNKVQAFFLPFPKPEEIRNADCAYCSVCV
jgi:hypothetical protein